MVLIRHLEHHLDKGMHGEAGVERGEAKGVDAQRRICPMRINGGCHGCPQADV